MTWEFVAPHSSQKSTDVDADGVIFAVFSEDGGSFLTIVVEVPGTDTRNDGVKTAIELVFMKAFVISVYLDDDGAEGAKGGLGLGTKDL